ncbi:GbsR/MarR family transcriptional regulator [Nonomuraea sp. GTA35]|uniref:GbsR/MarR family transcriptional regulator n=1 Tax=Nonomuraea sp. GTA35 TaxID=1676746 RepID=UPI0035C113F8
MSSLAGDLSPLIDDFGLRIGRAMGWPPMAGRAAGVLMLSPEPMTTAELQSALDASKGSVSEITRLLVDSGTVRRFKQPGSRQYGYEWRADAWIGCLQHVLEQTKELLVLAEHARARGDELPEPQRGRLHEMHEYYTFMVRHIEVIFEEYRTLKS